MGQDQFIGPNARLCRIGLIISPIRHFRLHLIRIVFANQMQLMVLKQIRPFFRFLKIGPEAVKHGYALLFISPRHELAHAHGLGKATAFGWPC